MNEEDGMDLQALSDRQEIAELLYRYARGVDTRDWALWRSVFTEDAVLDYTSAPGGIAGNRETVASWLETVLAMFPMTQHYITNIESDIDGDTATVRAMFYNPMLFPGATEPSFCGGQYEHDLLRTPDGWRSRCLIEHNSWFVNPPAGLDVNLSA
jgi:hypothetical protein